MRVYAYGYGCPCYTCIGDAEVEIDMQEYLDAEYNGQYKVNEQPVYYEEEDCWSAAVWNNYLD